MRTLNLLFLLLVLSTVNLIACEDSYHTIDTSACGFFESPSGKYTWQETGTYNDTIPNASGCDSILTIQLEINKIPEPRFEAFHISNCVPGTSYVRNITDDYNFDYFWDFGNGVTSTSREEYIEIIYSKPGYYIPTLTAINNGCSSTTTFWKRIEAFPNPRLNVVKQLNHCKREVKLSLEPDSIAYGLINWTLPDSNVFLKKDSIYSGLVGKYWVEGTSIFGCSSKKMFSVEFDFCKKPGGMKLRPNPSNGYVRIENIQPGTTIKLLSLDGKQYDIGSTNEEGQLYTYLTFLNNGLYYIVADVNGELRYSKLFLNK